MQYFETSSATGENVDALFETAASLVMDGIENQRMEPTRVWSAQSNCLFVLLLIDLCRRMASSFQEIQTSSICTRSRRRVAAADLHHAIVFNRVEGPYMSNGITK